MTNDDLWDIDLERAGLKMPPLSAQNRPVTIKLSARDSATVRELIESDAEPNEALRKAAQRYRENRPVSPSDAPDGPRVGEGATNAVTSDSESDSMEWLYHSEICSCRKCLWFRDIVGQVYAVGT